MKIKKEIAWAFKLVWAKMATKKIEIKKIFGMDLQINLDLQQQLKFLIVPLSLGLHPSPLVSC